eukprot:3388143-Amphidinium_carterae.1
MAQANQHGYGVQAAKAGHNVFLVLTHVKRKAPKFQVEGMSEAPDCQGLQQAFALLFITPRRQDVIPSPCGVTVDSGVQS